MNAIIKDVQTYSGGLEITIFAEAKEIDMTIKLGDKVADKISGFAGIVTAIAKYLNGCTRILIEPTKLDEDGKLLRSVWFDDVQVEVVGVSEFNSGKKKVGGPARSDPGRSDPA